MRITPLNARDLLEDALLLDGKDPGEHVEALRAQFRRQVVGGYAERAAERNIKNRTPRRARGPAVTPRTRVRGPTRTPTLAERSDAEVLFAFDKVKECHAKAVKHSTLTRQHQRNLEAVTNELKRRGMWVAA